MPGQITSAERSSRFVLIDTIRELISSVLRVLLLFLFFYNQNLSTKNLAFACIGVEYDLKKYQPFHRYDFLWKTCKASALGVFCR